MGVAQPCTLLLKVLTIDTPFGRLAFMKRISVHLTEQQIVTLHRLSHETGLKFAELLRRFIDEGVAREERLQRERDRRVHAGA